MLIIYPCFFSQVLLKLPRFATYNQPTKCAGNNQIVALAHYLFTQSKQSYSYINNIHRLEDHILFEIIMIKILRLGININTPP